MSQRAAIPGSGSRVRGCSTVSPSHIIRQTLPSAAPTESPGSTTSGSAPLFQASTFSFGGFVVPNQCGPAFAVPRAPPPAVRKTEITATRITVIVAVALREIERPVSEVLVIRTVPAFGGHPRDDLVRIGDVAGLAVHAVGEVDLQALEGAV